MTKSELTILLQQELKGLTTKLDGDDYDNAVVAAERDTGWTLPQSTNFKIKWLLERSKRHIFFYLLSESTAKFRYKNIYLQHRFDHYSKMVDRMDKDFTQALENDAFEFADVSSYQIAGTKLDAGFASEGQTGRDRTYDEDNEVLITPNENS